MANRMFTVTSTLTTVRRAKPTPPVEKGESVAMDVSNYPWLKTDTSKSFALSMGRHEPPLPVRFKDKSPKPEAKTGPDLVDITPATADDAADDSEEDNG